MGIVLVGGFREGAKYSPCKTTLMSGYPFAMKCPVYDRERTLCDIVMAGKNNGLSSWLFMDEEYTGYPL